MRKLSSSIVALIFAVSLYSQTSPHGQALVTNCTDCHKTSGWKVDEASINFNHSSTKFPLVGQHKAVSCKACHKSLEFSKTQTDCYVCHNDMHQQTLGNDCGRCHTPNSWLVTNITQLHQQSRFPLIGPHVTADCKDCHKNFITSDPSASVLRFDQLGVECYDCHKKDYEATTAPNHVQSNYSTNCTDCHNINSFSWSGAGINHNFFPLEGGHDINDCNKCHTSGTYSKIPAECVTCHQTDYNSANNPNHATLNFSTNCTECHSLNPGWKPAEYRNHDAKFPIYSGEHNGEWNSCSDCHKNPSNYVDITCTDCHEHNKGDMDDEHGGISGYEYNSSACYACHPTGSGEGGFDHKTSAFPLTGAHTTTDCASCHTNGYAGTSNVCASCHTPNYNQTTNPNHTTLNISTDCAVCHTTSPDWKPATFATHSNYYVLAGAHAPIANDCASCHQGNYTNTPNTCAGCHINNYNQTTNPNHTTAQFPTTCETCHSKTTWVPSTFNHNVTYPLTGAHATIADNCTQCHVNGFSNTPNTCVGCHQNNYDQATNPSHTLLGITNDCATCHTTNPGWAPATFPIHNNYYVLAGAHISIANDCAICHKGNYNNTPNTCAGCHMSDYNKTTDPNHAVAKFPTTCETCHKQSTWTPSTFNHDGQYFPIYSGKHSGRWNSCAECHTNPANFAVFTCTTSCHPQSQTNSDHQGENGYSYNSNACLSCHPDGSSKKSGQKINRLNLN